MISSACVRVALNNNTAVSSDPFSPKRQALLEVGTILVEDLDDWYSNVPVMRLSLGSCNSVQIPTNKLRFDSRCLLMKSDCSTIGAKNVLSSPTEPTEQRSISIAAIKYQ